MWVVDFMKNILNFHFLKSCLASRNFNNRLTVRLFFVALGCLASVLAFVLVLNLCDQNLSWEPPGRIGMGDVN